MLVTLAGAVHVVVPTEVNDCTIGVVVVGLWVIVPVGNVKLPVSLIIKVVNFAIIFDLLSY